MGPSNAGSKRSAEQAFSGPSQEKATAAPAHRNASHSSLKPGVVKPQKSLEIHYLKIKDAITLLEQRDQNGFVKLVFSSEPHDTHHGPSSAQAPGTTRTNIFDDFANAVEKLAVNRTPSSAVDDVSRKSASSHCSGTAVSARPDQALPPTASTPSPPSVQGESTRPIASTPARSSNNALTLDDAQGTENKSNTSRSVSTSNTKDDRMCTCCNAADEERHYKMEKHYMDIEAQLMTQAKKRKQRLKRIGEDYSDDDFYGEKADLQCQHDAIEFLESTRIADKWLNITTRIGRQSSWHLRVHALDIFVQIAELLWKSEWVAMKMTLGGGFKDEGQLKKKPKTEAITSTVQTIVKAMSDKQLIIAINQRVNDKESVFTRLGELCGIGQVWLPKHEKICLFHSLHETFHLLKKWHRKGYEDTPDWWASVGF